MSNEQHYRALEAMYQAAPLNKFYLPEMTVEEGTAEITIDIDSKLFHSGGAAHGSVYFKELDDAAFFAVNSLEPEVFVLTTSFTTYITRPISRGQMIAKGRVVNRNRSQWIAESVAYDSDGREIARGNGIFVRSKMLLAETLGYKEYLKQNMSV
ncbi:PaaI family thioesterase [Spongorhabdus nitratireducens]